VVRFNPGNCPTTRTLLWGPQFTGMSCPINSASSTPLLWMTLSVLPNVLSYRFWVSSRPVTNMANGFLPIGPPPFPGIQSVRNLSVIHLPSPFLAIESRYFFFGSRAKSLQFPTFFS